jgi:hypothetical protein
MFQKLTTIAVLAVLLLASCTPKAARNGFGKPDRVTEPGVYDTIGKPVSGDEDIVYDFANGLRSSMSYLGFRSIEEMRGGLWTNKIQAVRNSPNSMYEGFAHGK